MAVMPRHLMPRHLPLLPLMALILSGCIGNREIPLEGQRFGSRVPLSETLPNEAGEFPVVAEAQENASRPISLAPAQSLGAWPQRAGNDQNLIPHAALAAAPTEIFAVDIGQGNSRRNRISADPVAAAGRVFTMDALGRVTATSTGGGRLWQTDLTAGFDRGGGISGGGLAVADGRVFAATGYGELVALSAESGAEIWRQRLDASVTAPTVSGGLVYAVSRDGQGWGIEAENGRIRWRLASAPAGAVLTGGAAPALAGDLIVFPFGTGELIAATAGAGVRQWGTAVSGARGGVAYDSINDITGDPVFRGGVIYAGNQSGRVVALDAADGTLLWTASEGAYSPLLTAGDSVFFVSDRNELLRIDAATGARIWGVELPLFVNERTNRRRAVFTHYGPILAGGRLVVASGDGQIRFFSPEDGASLGGLPIRGGAAANPIVVGDSLYVVSEAGRLHAYR